MNAIRYQIATQLKSDVSVEDAKLALAQVCLGQNAPLKARRWGRDVARGGVEPWARQAEEMLTKMPPIRWSDGLGGGTLAVAACRREGEETAFDHELAREISDRCRRLGLTVAALLHDDSGGTRPEPVVSSARAAGAVAVLNVELAIDRSKTGATVAIPFSDGAVLAASSTPGWSDRWQAMVNCILTHRDHLPRHAESIAVALARE